MFSEPYQSVYAIDSQRYTSGGGDTTGLLGTSDYVPYWNSTGVTTSPVIRRVTSSMGLARSPQVTRSYIAPSYNSNIIHHHPFHLPASMVGVGMRTHRASSSSNFINAASVSYDGAATKTPRIPAYATDDFACMDPNLMLTAATSDAVEGPHQEYHLDDCAAGSAVDGSRQMQQVHNVSAQNKTLIENDNQNRRRTEVALPSQQSLTRMVTGDSNRGTSGGVRSSVGSGIFNSYPSKATYVENSSGGNQVPCQVHYVPRYSDATTRVNATSSPVFGHQQNQTSNICDTTNALSFPAESQNSSLYSLNNSQPLGGSGAVCLSHVTYVQANINPNYAGVIKLDRGVNTEAKFTVPTPAQSSRDPLTRICSLSPRIQEHAMVLINQENQIKILELQLALKQESGSQMSGQILPLQDQLPVGQTGEGLNAQLSSTDISVFGEQLQQAPQQIMMQQMQLKQQQSDAEQHCRKKINENNLKITNTQRKHQTPEPSKPASSDKHNHQQPQQIPMSRLLGSPGSLSLDEIKQINASNLQLATNTHLQNPPDSNSSLPSSALPASMVSSDGIGGLPFTDVEKVKSTLMALNPTWQGTSEELLAAMKAHLSGKQIDLAPGLFSATSGTTSAPASRQMHEGFKRVCHVQTHSLEIEQFDDCLEKLISKKLAVIQVYPDPVVSVISDFLWDTECEYFLNISQPHWTAVDEALASGKPTHAEGIAKLPKGKSEIVDRVSRRAAGALQVEVDDLEELVVLRYKAGVECKPHLESLVRRSTLITYLNDVTAGGETDFVNLGFQIRPEKGTAVLWHNVKLLDQSEGTFDKTLLDERMLHGSLAPQNDEVKYAIAVYVQNTVVSSAECP